MRPKEALLIALILIGIFFALYPMRLEMGGEDTSTVNAEMAVITKAVESSSSGIPSSVLENAQAVAVIPSIVEGTLMTGRGSGEGLMVVRRDDGNRCGFRGSCRAYRCCCLSWGSDVWGESIWALVKTPREARGGNR